MAPFPHAKKFLFICQTRHFICVKKIEIGHTTYIESHDREFESFQIIKKLYTYT